MQIQVRNQGGSVVPLDIQEIVSIDGQPYTKDYDAQVIAELTSQLAFLSGEVETLKEQINKVFSDLVVMQHTQAVTAKRQPMYFNPDA